MSTMIFRHSFNRSLRLLGIFPGAALSFYIVYLLVLKPGGQEIPGGDFMLAGTGIFFVMATIVAIIVGINVIAEERAAGTAEFLARLPITHRRLLMEKLSAGVAFLILLYVAIIIYYGMVPEERIALSRDGGQTLGNYPLNLLVSLFTAFAFAVVFSLYLRQPLAIFLAALTAEGLFWVIIQVVASDRQVDWRGAGLTLTYLFLFFAVPGLLSRHQRQFNLPPDLLRRGGRFSNLVLKELAGDGMLNVMAGMLLLGALGYWLLMPDTASLETRQQVYELQNSISRYVLIGMSLLLPISLGAHAYSGRDGRGLDSVLHYLPLARYHLLGAKLLAAVPMLLSGWFGLVIAYQGEVPPVSLAVFLCFLYVSAMHTSLWLRSPMLAIQVVASAAIVTYYLIGGWMSPREFPWYFRGFQPVNDPYLVGLAPLSALMVGGVLSTAWLAGNRRFLAATDLLKARYCNLTIVATVSLSILVAALARRLFEL